MKPPITLLFLLTITIGYTQSSLKFDFESTQKKISLRWICDSPELQEAAFEHGVNLYRRDHTISGQSVDYVASLNSTTTLLSNAKPLLASEWDQYTGVEDAQFAKTLLYGAEANPTYDSDNVAAAVEKREFEDSKHMFYALIADRNFEIATGLALAYGDTDINAGDTYVYTLEINHPDYVEYKVQLTATTGTVSYLQPMKIQPANPKENYTKISWLDQKEGKQYAAYNIMRSEHGADNWIVRNDIPYIFSADPALDSDIITYTDTLENVSLQYDYKVIGLTPYGNFGPDSDVITTQSKPDKKFIPIVASEGIEGEGYVEVVWQAVNPEFAESVDYYDIYRAEHISAQYEKINNTPLPKSSTSYKDYNPLSSGYYIVYMYDTDGYVHYSGSTLVQQEDITPPAVPVNISAVADNDGTITITWDDNTEEDLKGYRVYRSNFSNSAFMDIHGETVLESQFTEKLSTNVTTDSIFYKILALDIRSNYSEYSEAVALSRPDKVAPSDPLLHSVVSLESGIYLDWELSQDSDVARHIIQRKSSFVPNWTDVLTISPVDSTDYTKKTLGLFPYRYIDNSSLEQVEYEYRIKATDTWENTSYSAVLKVVPLYIPELGEINNFSIEYLCHDTIDQNNLNTQVLLGAGLDSLNIGSPVDIVLSQLAENGGITSQDYVDLLGVPSAALSAFINSEIDDLQESEDIELCGNQLTWSYKALNDLKYYKIYRTHESGEKILFASIPSEDCATMAEAEWQYIDEAIIEESNYAYSVIAEYLTGDKTNETVTVTIETTIEE